MEFSFFTMVAQASLVAQCVLAFLLLMSVGSWGLMIQKAIALNAAQKKALSGTARFEKAATLREAVQSLGSDPSSPLYYVAHQGVLEFNRSKELGNDSEVVVDNVRRALRQGVASEMSRLQSSLSLLATAANTAPFIGLFGTVWGVMLAFCGIAAAGKSDFSALAPGVAGALLTTVAGLIVAIPSLIGYNLLTSTVRNIATQLDNFSDEFMARVKLEQLSIAKEQAREQAREQAAADGGETE